MLSLKQLDDGIGGTFVLLDTKVQWILVVSAGLIMVV
jgi:hypothetical protein